MQNNCDGSGPHAEGEVRVLPLTKDPHHGNLILCPQCFRREMMWRFLRNTELGEEAQYEIPDWQSLEVYRG